MQVKIHAEPIDEKKEKKEYGKYDKWEVEGWVDSIIRAEEVKSDPEKMKYVKMCMDKKYGAAKKAIASIEDIKLARQEKDEEPDEEMEYES